MNQENNDQEELSSTEQNNTTDSTESDQEASTQNMGYKDGELITLVNVRFPGEPYHHHFLLKNFRTYLGQKVVAQSDRGMNVGYINSLPYQMPFKKSLLPLRRLSKEATDEDLNEKEKSGKEESRAFDLCQDLIDKYKLDMNLTHVEFIQYGKKAVFYFTAPERVDFRELVKNLVSDLKMRIELRQISIRDRTASIGSIGPCGRQTCCSTFLKNFGGVGIRQAKNQDLNLLPAKLNGICGQTKCCLKYEDNVYSDKRNKLPNEGAFIQTKNGDIGKVTKLHILLEQFEMITDKGQKRKYSIELYDKKAKLPSDWKFPKQFDHITNETNEIITLPKKENVEVKSSEEKNSIDETADFEELLPGPNLEEEAKVEEQQENQPVRPQENQDNKDNNKRKPYNRNNNKKRRFNNNKRPNQNNQNKKKEE